MQQPHPHLLRAFALWDSGRKPEALVILNQLASRNDPNALATLAEMKWGGLLPQDPVRARELYQRASEAGHERAGIAHTNLLASGIAGPRDWPLALKRLRQEARKHPDRRKTLAAVEKMKLTPEGDPLSVPTGRALSGSPEVRLFPKLFSPAECDYLKQVAAAGYQPSAVHDSSGRLVKDPIRTSDGSTIHWLIEDPAAHALNRRLAAASGTAFDQGEAMQILRYLPGQEYRKHLDFVRASDNQRILTALVYLNEDYEGGETCFVRADLRVKGGRGDAIVFRNAAPDRRPDPMSEHAGLPVTNGTKYLASRWIREKRWVP